MSDQPTIPVPVPLLQAVVNYLEQQPFKAVVGLLGGLNEASQANVKAQDAPPHEPVPPPTKRNVRRKANGSTQLDA